MVSHGTPFTQVKASRKRRNPENIFLWSNKLTHAHSHGKGDKDEKTLTRSIPRQKIEVEGKKKEGKKNLFFYFIFLQVLFCVSLEDTPHVRSRNLDITTKNCSVSLAC